MEAGPQPASTRTSSLATERLNQRRRCDPPSLESDMLQDLRLILKAISRPEGSINSVVRASLKDYNSHWRKYKRWCLEAGWLSFTHTQMSVTMAQDQLMAFLDFVKPSMQAYSTFCNHKSAIVCSFRILLGFELGKDPLII